MKTNSRFYLLAVGVLWLGVTAAAQRPEPQSSKTLRPRDLSARLVGHAHIDLAWLWRAAGQRGDH